MVSPCGRRDAEKFGEGKLAGETTAGANALAVENRAGIPAHQVAAVGAIGQLPADSCGLGRITREGAKVKKQDCPNEIETDRRIPGRCLRIPNIETKAPLLAVLVAWKMEPVCIRHWAV
jgi:hypothetical protein